MAVSDKCRNVKKKKKQKSSLATSKSEVATSKVATSSSRIAMHFPKNSISIKKLHVSNNGDRRSFHEKVDHFVQLGMKRRDQELEELWDEFCKKSIKLYPEQKLNIEKLSPYIKRRIMKNEKLTDNYFEWLREDSI